MARTGRLILSANRVSVSGYKIVIRQNSGRELPFTEETDFVRESR